jgi:tRNA1Val (adenine37-N6)-methyltransferase
MNLQSPDKRINAARHALHLTLEDILEKVCALLTPDGVFAILLPYSRSSFFIAHALRLGLYVSKQYIVRPTTKHGYFRSILFLHWHAGPTATEALTIKNMDNKYTAEFVAALKDYYLYL